MVSYRIVLGIVSYCIALYCRLLYCIELYCTDCLTSYLTRIMMQDLNDEVRQFSAKKPEKKILPNV